jgi:hypothetical protein
LAIPAFADPDLPIIPSRTTNLVLTAGGTDNAGSINGAITAISGAGGGTVEISSNSTSPYLSGPITMKSSVNLQIDSGAMLQMLPMSSWPGTTTFINASGINDSEISGGGTIDGQGSAWWSCYESSGCSRPNFIAYTGTQRILIQGVTLQNPPTFTIYLKNNNGNVTVQNMTINTPTSPNTDGFDIASTNVLIRNCYISDGDDNIEIGGNGGPVNNMTVSNCTFGIGHGVSIGSDTEGGVNNLLVSNCYWVGTEYGIKGKSDTDRGGTMQNLVYTDLHMTNVNFAIAFYSYYKEIGSPSSSFTFTPSTATTESDAGGSHIPMWKNITVSNLTATGIGGNVAAFFWGLPKAPITNFTLCDVNISAPTKTFCMYNVRGIQFIDSNLTAPTSGTNTLTIYNAQFSITNTNLNTNTVTITGLGSPSNSVLSLSNGLAETSDAILGADPQLTLASSTFTVSNALSAGGTSTFNFGLGTNATTTAVTGNLTVGGTLNVADGGGFANNTTYTLFTYGGALTYNGLTVGTTPNGGFTYSVSTNTQGQVNLIVGTACPVGAAGSITGSASVNAGANGVTYSISSVSGATTYAWTVPSGATVASGQGTTSITINYSCAAASGNVQVTPSNGTCNGGSSSLSVTVTGVGAAGTITGSASVNAGASGVAYSISSVSGATSYTWTVPSGATIASGQGTTSITVNYACSASSGSVQVTPSNANGCSGTPANLAVTVTSVGAAGSISGLTSVAAGTNGVTYSISSVSGATTYAWTVPTGASIASGQGTTSITVNYACSASSGNVQVTPSNGSCNGTPASLAVTITSVGAAGNISGASTVCAGQTGAVYSISSVNGATTYTWIVPAEATITSGQGTTSITVTWGSTAGNVQVTPSNGNGCTGTASSLPVAVNAAPSITSNPSPQTVCAGATAHFTVSASGAGLSYQWQENGSNISDGGTISGSGTITLTLTGVGLGDSGASFDCVVSGTCSPPATSGAATLTVNAGGGPATFNVTGGGAFCAGGSGVTVGLDGSESSADYQLEVNGSPTGAPFAGTGSAISFSNQTAVGTYTVIASNATSGCTATMNGSANVSLTDPFTCWQFYYFGTNNCALCSGDASYTGDGMSNTNKFLAGFNPANSAAYLHVTGVLKSGTNIVVSYLGASGDTNYVPGVQSGTNVLDFMTGGVGGSYANGVWQDTGQTNILGVGISAAGGEGTGAGTVTNMTDVGGATNVPSRYYRIRLVP